VNCVKRREVCESPTLQQKGQAPQCFFFKVCRPVKRATQHQQKRNDA